ncbi:MAG TPA: nickel pincer cofactor biosynthesis protein LarB [Victivallales bacterium]|nr:nickel pincer cofactor biosynthesis protein LarB [Victivallales bacterium]
MKKIKEINYDESRSERCGFPEFIYGEGKTLDQLRNVVREIRKRQEAVVVTRLCFENGLKLKKFFREGVYDERARVFYIKSGKIRSARSKITIVTAGTCDLPVALEALRTLEACGFKCDFIADSGVAGIHRLMRNVEVLRQADVIIAVAGMEGALPSVIGGLVSCPVIAVPTSVGYGTSMKGIAAMLAMLNSCANGVTVVNIDNGFGAACAAMRIANTT